MKTDHLLVGRYRFIRELGHGGMGEVFMAHDLHLHNRPCVVKKIREDFCKEQGKENALKYFQQEARTLSQLSHPNIVQITDFFEEDGEYFLVMEYVEGKNLRQIVKERGSPVESKQVIDWAIQICSVLEYLHEHEPSIVYRDLKPSNLMVDVNGVLKLVDFGIARQYAASDEHTQVISEGYSAPEQYRGFVDPRSDIYALGTTMYFLLTGEDPVPLTPCKLQDTNIDDAIVRIVETATSQNLDLRFQTAYAMRQALITAALPHAVPLFAPWPRILTIALIFVFTLVCLGYLIVHYLH
jgi:serine/threonine protein kinase